MLFRTRRDSVGNVALSLHYREYGSGPPVLLLHGLFGSGRNWHSLAGKLSANYRVFAIDLRNHGNSPWSESMTYAEMAEDVRSLIEQLQTGPACVLGHSMGGKTAMVMALNYPEIIERLIIVDIAPVSYAGSLSSFTDAMQKIDLSVIANRRDADQRLAELLPEQPAGVRAFLLQNLISVEGCWQWRINLRVISESLSILREFPELSPDKRFAGATAFIAGASSDYILDSHTREINRLFPSNSRFSISGAGHWVHADQPAQFLDTLSRFLQSG